MAQLTDDCFAFSGPLLPLVDMERLIAERIAPVGDTERVEKEVAAVARRLAPHVELWLGGRGAERLAKQLKGRALPLATYDSLEQHLVRLGARF